MRYESYCILLQAIYAATAGGPGIALPIADCGDDIFCDYETFVELTRDVVISRENFLKECFI